MLKIRFFKIGLKKNKLYWLVIINSKNPINGKFIEKIGFFNSHYKLKKINIKRFFYWKEKGAKPTNSVLKIINEFIKHNNK